MRIELSSGIAQPMISFPGLDPIPKVAAADNKDEQVCGRFQKLHPASIVFIIRLIYRRV